MQFEIADSESGKLPASAPTILEPKSSILSPQVKKQTLYAMSPESKLQGVYLDRISHRHRDCRDGDWRLGLWLHHFLKTGGMVCIFAGCTFHGHAANRADSSREMGSVRFP